jgi:hypothetical protein
MKSASCFIEEPRRSCRAFRFSETILAGDVRRRGLLLGSPENIASCDQPTFRGQSLSLGQRWCAHACAEVVLSPLPVRGFLNLERIQAAVGRTSRITEQ